MAMNLGTGAARDNVMKEKVALDPMLDVSAMPEEHRPTKRDSFVASVGQTVDEELSISPFLNNEEYFDRERQLEAYKEDVGEEGIAPYRNQDGSVDYDRLVREKQPPGMYDNATLWRRRQDRLQGRRAYAQPEMEENFWSTMAGGAAAGMGLDPLVALTMPLGLPAARLHSGLTALQRAGRLGMAEAAIGAATEIPIQAIVYSYKQTIGSEYNKYDVAGAIAGSAVFAGSIGGLVGFLTPATKGMADWTKNYFKDGEEGLVAELEATVRDMAANPGRPSREAVTASITRVARLTNQELQDLVDSYKGSSGALEELSQDDWLDVRAAEGLLNSRKQVAKRELAEFDRAEPVEGELPVGPQRAAEARKMDDPVVLTKFRAVVADAKKKVEAVQAKIDKVTAKLKKAESSAKGSARQLKKDTAKDRESLNKLEEQKVKAEEKQKAAEENVRKAEEAQVGEENARIEQLIEADQEFVDRLYEQGLLEADIRFLRQQQADYDRLNMDNAPPDVDNAATVTTAGGRTVSQDEAGQGVIDTVMSDNPPVEMMETTALLDKLKAAEGCYV